MSISRELDNIINQINREQKVRVSLKFNLQTIMSTWFFLGFISFMPGTIASLSVYPIYKFMIFSSSSYSEIETSLCISSLVLLIIGWFAVKRFEADTMSHDHKSIVIDEVIGQLLVLGLSCRYLHKLAVVLAPYIDLNVIDLSFLIGVAFFRFFDIKKPFFIKKVDLNVKGALGVMLDDILAAIFAFGSIYIIYGLYNAFS